MFKFLLLMTTAIPREGEGMGGGGAPADTGGGAPSGGDSGGSSAPVDTGGAPADTGSNGGGEPAPKASLEDQLSKIWDNKHIPREEGGRFAKRNPDDPATEVPGEGDPLEGEGDQPGENGEKVTDPNAATVKEMPVSWSKEKAELWASLPPEAQDLIASRESETQQALSRAGNVMKAMRSAKPVLDAITPYNDYLGAVAQQTGIQAPELLGQVLKFEHTLRTSQDNNLKLTILKDIIGTYGVDVSPLLGEDINQALHAGGRTDATDPRVDSLLAEIAELKNIALAPQREAAAKEAQAIENGIRSIESNPNEYPYFDEVRELMGAIVGQMPEDPDVPVSKVLRDAYEMACRASPTVFAKVEADIRRKAEQDLRTKARTKTTRAQEASGVNVRGGVPSQPKRSSDETLMSIADKFYR